jgi:hypothetical protein
MFTRSAHTPARPHRAYMWARRRCPSGYPCLAAWRHQWADALASRHSGTPAKKCSQELPSGLSCSRMTKAPLLMQHRTLSAYWWW